MIKIKINNIQTALIREYCDTETPTEEQIKAVDDKMKAVLKERGYIVNRAGKKLARVDEPYPFDWAIRTGALDIIAEMVKDLKGYMNPYRCNVYYNVPEETIKVALDGIPEDKLPIIKEAVLGVVETGNGFLRKGKFNVEITETPREELEAVSMPLFKDAQ